MNPRFAVDKYWESEIDPCRRCANIGQDVRCDVSKIRPFLGPARPVVMVLAQDPTLGARFSTNVAMEMDDEKSRLRKFVIEEILQPLGFDVEQAYVTDLVKCRFIKTPRELASERRVEIAEIIRPAARTCRMHLEWEFATLDPNIVITLGRPVYELLAAACGLASVPPLRDAVAQVSSKLIFGRERVWIPCVHWNTLHGRWRKEYYGRLQPKRLLGAKSGLYTGF